MLDCGIIQIICRQLTNTADVKLKLLTLKSLAMTFDMMNDLHSRSLPTADVVQALCACLRLQQQPGGDDVTLSDSDTAQAAAVRSHALTCLEQLAAHSAHKDVIRKQHGVDLMCALLSSGGGDEQPVSASVVGCIVALYADVHAQAVFVCSTGSDYCAQQDIHVYSP